jgi:hypothetical protein
MAQHGGATLDFNPEQKNKNKKQKSEKEKESYPVSIFTVTSLFENTGY